MSPSAGPAGNPPVRASVPGPFGPSLEVQTRRGVTLALSLCPVDLRALSPVWGAIPTVVDSGPVWTTTVRLGTTLYFPKKKLVEPKKQINKTKHPFPNPTLPLVRKTRLGPRDVKLRWSEERNPHPDGVRGGPESKG